MANEFKTRRVSVQISSVNDPVSIADLFERSAEINFFIYLISCNLGYPELSFNTLMTVSKHFTHVICVYIYIYFLLFFFFVGYCWSG